MNNEDRTDDLIYADRTDDLIYADRLDDLGMHEAASVLRGDAPARPIEIVAGRQYSFEGRVFIALSVGVGYTTDQLGNVVIQIRMSASEQRSAEHVIRNAMAQRMVSGFEHLMFPPFSADYINAQPPVNDATTQAMPFVIAEDNTVREWGAQAVPQDWSISPVETLPAGMHHFDEQSRRDTLDDPQPD